MTNQRDKTEAEVDFLEAYVEYKKSSDEMIIASNKFTTMMKESKPTLAAAWSSSREDELDNFNAEKAEAAAVALHGMSRVYREMADALKKQSETLSKTADLAHILVEQAKEAADA